ncbi:hypothetical protein CALCODRAFT_418641, partial [Calocera cornea HHB12733]
RWEKELGQVFVYRQLLGRYRICTTDPHALSHVLSHAYAYPKPAHVSRIGAGMLTAEADVHRRQ